MIHIPAVLRSTLIVQSAGCVRIKSQSKLIKPPEFKTGLAHGMIPYDRHRMVFGHIGGMGGNLVSNHALLYILTVRKSEVFLRCHIAQHGTAVPSDHGSTDPGGEMIISRCYVCYHRTEGIERGTVAVLLLHRRQGKVLRHRKHRSRIFHGNGYKGNFPDYGACTSWQ